MESKRMSRKGQMANRADRKLIAGIRKGQPESFDTLYELYKLPIFNFIYQMVGDVEEAKDLTQDTFVAIYQVLSGDRNIENLKAYTYAVARNKVLERIKLRARESPDEEFLARVPDESYYADPARAARNRKQQADIMKALQGMPGRYREVLVLREQAGFSYEQIAAMLDTNRTNVGVMIYRARSKFREMYRMLQITEKPGSEECERMLPLISGWLDGELKDRQEREVQAHMKDCPFCRLASEQMVEASNTFHGLIPLLLPLSVKAAVMSKVGMAGAVPVSVAAAASGAGAGAGTALSGGSHAASAPGAAASASTFAAGTGAGAGTAAAGGLSGKAIGIAVAAIVAAAAAGGGTYVGIREAYRKPAATVQSLRAQIREFLSGERAYVDIPAALRQRASDLETAARRFIEEEMPGCSYLDIVKAAQAGPVSTLGVSGLQEDQGSQSVDCYLQVVRDDEAYQVRKVTREFERPRQ